MINTKFCRDAGRVSGYNNKISQGEAVARAKSDHIDLARGVRSVAQNLLLIQSVQFNFYWKRGNNSTPKTQEDIGLSTLGRASSKAIGGPQQGQSILSNANDQVGQMNQEVKTDSPILTFNPSSMGNVKSMRELISEAKSTLQTQRMKARGLDQLELQFVQEVQQIHTESMLLKLLKKAATPSNSDALSPTTAEAIDLVKSRRFIEHQPTAADTFSRIAEKLESHMELKNIDVESELKELQKSKNNPFEKNIDTDIDIDKIRTAAVQLALYSNRIDKKDTGLKNSIIIDSEDNLIALKNSASADEKHFENEVLNNRVGDMLLNNAGFFLDSDEEVKDHYDILLNADEEKETLVKKELESSQNKNTVYTKLIVGRGGFGIVRLGEKILTEEVIAIKKMREIKHAISEFGEKQKLMESLKKNPDDMKYFLTADTITNSHGKYGEKKAYLTSQLQDGDGYSAITKIHELRSSDKNSYMKSHGELITKTLTALEALDRNGIVHGDLKWKNIIGGKIADLDGLCHKYGDEIKVVTSIFFPPDIPIAGRKEKRFHPTEESYNKHTSFILGRMLLESVEPYHMMRTFPLKLRPGTYKPLEGYSKEIAPPMKNSAGENFTPYEKAVIRLAFTLADTEPSNRPTIADAKKAMHDIIAAHRTGDDSDLSRSQHI